MNFEEFCEEIKGVQLRSWQKKVANAFLAEMHKYQESATGKSFLLHLLTEFVNSYGNFYPYPYCRCKNPARGRYQEKCSKCGQWVLSENKCPTCGKGKRFLFTNYCPWCFSLKPSEK
ncbi:MAG: hypothetical protein SWH61_03410 [Thermodesulfobacteriota bacterium]|nr:hypothetical protein [Thermodesulfobacteriota bacterium]